MFYTSLEQRMAQNYINMLPPFVPDDAAPVSVQEQRQFYDLMENLYQLAFNEPLLFVPTLHEDDAYPSRYKKPYGKPNLILDMKKFTKEIDALLQNMFLLGQGNNITFNKRQKTILFKLGIEDFTKLPVAWNWISSRENAHIIAFSHCVFNENYPYSSDIYARLLGEAAFRKLENWMLSKGYERFDIYDITASDCKLSLTIASPKWSDDPPSGGFEYKIKHTGISALIDPYTSEPHVLGLCIPKGMKLFLQNFDSMDDKLRSFVIRQNKQCNGCKYCIQTDKTGTRPMAFIPITYDDKEYRMCTYFPGYNYCWTHIDDDLAEEIIGMLSFMDKFAPSK